MERFQVDPEIKAALRVIISEKGIAEIIIKEKRASSERFFLKLLGEEIYNNFRYERNKTKWKRFSKERMRKIGKAIMKSGNTKSLFCFMQYFKGNSKFPKDVLREGMESIIFGSGPASSWYTFELLTTDFLPDFLPYDLMIVAKNRLNKSFLYGKLYKSKTDVIRVLDSILHDWVMITNSMLLHSRGRRDTMRTNSGIIFILCDPWMEWRLIDKNQKGALIGWDFKFSPDSETRSRRVVLLRDVNDAQAPGFAEDVCPEAKTVHHAIAWMFQQDPEKWKGFDKEA